MDSTLIQLINHIYDIEQENKILRDFIDKNEGILRANNAEMPGEPPPPRTEPS